MRASPAEYLRLDLRAHDLLRDVPLYDVSIVDLPGGGAGRSVADIRAPESAAAPSRVANTIYGLRHCLGRMFGWDHVQMRPEDSLLSRLSERDRRDSEITPGTPVGSFLLLYQFPGEALTHPVPRYASPDSARVARRLRGHGLGGVARPNARALGKDGDDSVRSTPIAPGWPKQRESIRTTSRVIPG
jgi:hypothetical protein